MKLDWLAAALHAEGLIVLEHSGWKTRTMRPFNDYTPVGLINHHTAGSSVLTNYPGPPWYPNHRLEQSCNLTIRGDGTVAVLNAGYAWDSGNGDRKVLAALKTDKTVPAPTDTYDSNGKPAGSNPGITGNPWFVDLEVQHLGNGDPINPPQREALIATNTAICKRMGWDPAYRLIGHREWTKRKVDPRWDGSANPMPGIRADTIARMEGDDMWSKNLDEAGWRLMAQAGIAAGTPEGVVDWWWTKRAERTDEQHREASQNMSAALAIKQAGLIVSPPKASGVSMTQVKEAINKSKITSKISAG